MAKDFILDRLKNEFKRRESFSRDELFNFYTQFEPELKETTFRWRIYQLKAKRIIAVISKGAFTLLYKPTFKPGIAENERKIFLKLEKQFPTLKFCVWSTKMIHEFMLHFPGKFITILEVEKAALEPVYDFLRDQGLRNVFIQPEEKEIERYIYESDSSIILKALISKSPLQRVTKIVTITLEKLLVDLYADKKLLAAFQGNELTHIVNNAYNRYSIDFTKLFNYAKRRAKEIELMDFFTDSTDIPKNILND